MKKILPFIMCVLLVFSASACGSLEVKEDNNSVNSSSEYSEILINTNLLSSISIHNVYDEELIRIPVKEDWAFLSKYTKSHTLTKEETNKLLVYPDTHIIYLNNISDDGEEVVFAKIYLLKDGSIVKRQMCGDSGVTDVPYELYKADDKYMLDEEGLIDLLKKYDNNVTNTIESNNKMKSVKLEYITTACREVQARTKISVVDGTVYCMWVDVIHNDEGRDSETYVLDAFENGSWKNVSKQENEFEGSPYFEKSYVYPLCEKVGDKIIYTDSNNGYYLLDTFDNETYDLKMNLEDWRVFATDNENVFAVLSACTDGNGKTEIRIYDISKIEK